MGSGFSTHTRAHASEEREVTIPLGGEWILYYGVVKDAYLYDVTIPLGGEWILYANLPSCVSSRIAGNNPLGWGVDSLH